MTDAFETGDEAAFRARFRRLARLNHVLARYMTPRSVKAALAYLGRRGTTLRRPYLALAPDEQAALARELAALGIAPTTTGEPE